MADKTNEIQFSFSQLFLLSNFLFSQLIYTLLLLELLFFSNKKLTIQLINKLNNIIASSQKFQLLIQQRCSKKGITFFSRLHN